MTFADLKRNLDLPEYDNRPLALSADLFKKCIDGLDQVNLFQRSPEIFGFHIVEDKNMPEGTMRFIALQRDRGWEEIGRIENINIPTEGAQ